MHPILFDFHLLGNHFEISSYGVMIALGIFIAFYSGGKKADRYVMSKEDTILYGLIIMASGFLFAFGVYQLIALVDRARGMQVQNFGMVSWGGFTGAAFSAFFLSKYYKFSLSKFLDLAAPSAALGYGIGRLGCFLGGCCYGISTDSFLSFHFTHYLAPASYYGQPVLATQLISSFYLIAIFLVLSFIDWYRHEVSKKMRYGNLTAGFLILYSISRFIIEFWRNDYRGWWLGLSDAQWFSISALLLALAIIYFNNFATSTVKKEFTD